jgi:uncharacterized protein
MLIDIRSITRSMDAVLAIEVQTAPDQVGLSFQDYQLTRPLDFQGTIRHSGGGVIALTGRLRTAYRGECARCLVPVETALDLAVAETFRPAAQTGEEDDSYPYSGPLLDISQALRDNLVLAMPQRLYCREDCRGLCPVCGANCNETDCGHAGDSADGGSELA